MDFNSLTFKKQYTGMTKGLQKNPPIDVEFGDKQFLEMQKFLRMTGEAIAKKVSYRAVKAGTHYLEQKMKADAPIDTGDLRRNIAHKVKRYSGTIYGIYGSKWVDKQKNPGIYIHILEHGGKHYGKGLNPFARRSFNSNRQAAEALVLRFMKAGIAALPDRRNAA